MYSDNDDLSVEDRAAIAALPREMAPSDLLEERVVRVLKGSGHFNSVARPRARWGAQLLKIAAAVALFAGGVATGHFMLSQPAAAIAPQVKQASVTNPPPQTPAGAQTVKNNETVVAEREMWL